MQYKASTESNTMYRALHIINPTPDLSGLYRCTVSTYDGEATEAKRMIIYVPQKEIKFWHTIERDVKEENAVQDNAPKVVGNIVNVTCAAEGVFPEPIIRIYSESKLISDNSEVKTMLRSNNLYDVSTSVLIDDDDMNEHDHEFECELTIPEANYTVKRVIYVSLDSNLGMTWRMSVWLVLATLLIAAIASLM